LLFPPDGTRITAGQIVPFGVVQDTKDQVLGVLRDVYFYLRYPNGTEEYIMRMWDTCDSGAPGIILHGNSTGTSFVLMEEPGTYVYHNLTHIVSHAKPDNFFEDTLQHGR
jgi:hypothetical protein